MNYYNCNGTLRFIEYSIPVGLKNSVARINTKFNPDNFEYTGTLDSAFYNVRLSSVEVHSTGETTKQKPLSIAAKGIAGKSLVSVSQQSQLTVYGGELGIGANWVWYTDSCGGTYLSKGESINIYPEESSTYYVRAEGKNNVTACVSHTVDVVSKQPSYIMTLDEIYEGESVTLTQIDGELKQGSKWVWYDDNCGGWITGFGPSITITPTKTKTYYVRAVGTGEQSTCIKKTIKVKSLLPESINGNSFSEPAHNNLLTLKGGKLPKDSWWAWYADVCGENLLGYGSFIYVKPITTTTYFVRYETPYKNSNCISHQITVDQNNSMQITSFSKDTYISIDKIINRDNKFDIKFKINNAKSFQKFNANIESYTRYENLNTDNISSQLFDIKPDNLTSFKIDLSDKIQDNTDLILFNVTATSYCQPNLRSHLVKSFIFPGLGDLRLRNNNISILYGFLAYGLIGTSIHYYQKSNSFRDAYYSETSSPKTNYEKYIYYKNASRMLALSAAFVWSIDLAGIYKRYEKVKANSSVSEYYHQFSNQKVITNSQLFEIE
jgi:hypothetical protein